MGTEATIDDGLVTAGDLSTWLGEPIEGEEVGRAIAVLSYAWTLVETETGRDEEYWETNGVPAGVKNVVLQVASRGFTNPESWGNERVDDWGAGARPVEQLGMYLTAAEKGILSKWGERKLSSIGRISTSRGHPRDEPDLVFPWYGWGV